PLGENLTRITSVNEFILGKDGGVARLEVRDGGTVTTDLMVVGEFDSSPGMAATTADVILDGAGSAITINENLQMKLGGTFTVSGGAQLNSFANSALASDPNRNTIAPDRIGWSHQRSTMTVTGAGSGWTS